MTQEAQEISLEGIIIRVFASGDADAVIHIVSASKGKLPLFAPRARKVTSRNGKAKAAIDILDWGIFEAKQGKGNMLKLKHFIPRSSFHKIRENFEKLLLATFICEIFDVGLPEELPDENGKIFKILWSSLTKLNEAKDLKESFRITYITLTRLLQENGVLNSLESPSTHALLRLTAQLEHYTGKIISAKKNLLLAMERLKQEAPPPLISNKD